jgi:hypothetical protein
MIKRERLRTKECIALETERGRETERQTEGEKELYMLCKDTSEAEDIW